MLWELRTLYGKFGPDPPTGLGMHSEQTNKQTDRQTRNFMYIYDYRWIMEVSGKTTQEKATWKKPPRKKQQAKHQIRKWKSSLKADYQGIYLLKL